MIGRLAGFIGFNKWLLIGATVVTVTVSGYAYKKGWDHAKGQTAKDQAEALQKVLDKKTAMEQAMYAYAMAYERERAAQRMTFEQLSKEVDEYVKNKPAVQCFDADGLRIIANAARGVSTAAGEPHGEVP